MEKDSIVKTHVKCMLVKENAHVIRMCFRAIAACDNMFILRVIRTKITEIPKYVWNGAELMQRCPRENV